jgi:hypothetical protein
MHIASVIPFAGVGMEEKRGIGGEKRRRLIQQEKRTFRTGRARRRCVRRALARVLETKKEGAMTAPSPDPTRASLLDVVSKRVHGEFRFFGLYLGLVVENPLHPVVIEFLLPG